MPLALSLSSDLRPLVEASTVWLREALNLWREIKFEFDEVDRLDAVRTDPERVHGGWQ